MLWSSPGAAIESNDPFAVDDSVIVGNLFKPGSYIEPEIRQGVIASEIGASLRVDFSRNNADGTATDSLYSPQDAHGWRAAFFWHMNSNQENDAGLAKTSPRAPATKRAMVSDILRQQRQHVRPAPGGHRFGASPDSITIQGPLLTRQNDRDVRNRRLLQRPLDSGRRRGPGLGQVRKILSYSADPARGTIRFRVAPGWDVVPMPGTNTHHVGREYWQVITVAIRSTSVSRFAARVIALAKGRRYQRLGAKRRFRRRRQPSVRPDGITFQQYYNAVEASCPECRPDTSTSVFWTFRGNLDRRRIRMG